MDSLCFIVPTGLGASIGGFAGDASPYVKQFSKILPTITNPNTVNGACFSGINKNILYTEGLLIDKLFKDEISISPSTENKIGIIFDSAIPKNILNIHINTINAIKAVYGIEILGYEITKESVGVEFEVLENGTSTGIVKNPETLIKTAENLIKKGAEALGIVCLFEEPENDSYSKGKGVDPVGGVEAVISHLITDRFNIPAAHAPAFRKIDITGEVVDYRAAAEYITPTFLPCIILGLYNAPKVFLDRKQGDISVDNIKALIMPYNSLGCIPVLKATERNIPVIAVLENKTVLGVTAKSLGIEGKVKVVETYSKAEDFIKSIL